MLGPVARLPAAIPAFPAAAAEWPIVENRRAIGRIVYDPAHFARGPTAVRDGLDGPGAGVPEYMEAIASAIRTARRSLVGMGWPLARQVTGFTVEVADLGPSRLGSTRSAGRMRVSVPERLADPGEDYGVRLAATVAHEYLHLCQYRCWQGRPGTSESQYLWWMEATAIYLEHRLAPLRPGTGLKLLTYDDAVPEARGEHGRSGLESLDSGSNQGYCYAPMAFLLARGFGPSFIVRSWLAIADAPAGRPPPSAVQAIEITLAACGAAPERARFGHVLRDYALYMISQDADWIRSHLGLDIVQIERLGAPAPGELDPVLLVDRDLTLPAYSFRAFEVPPDIAPSGVLKASFAGPGLLCYALPERGGGSETRRLGATTALAAPDGERLLILVVNPSARDLAARLSLSPPGAAPGDPENAETD
jgi:hypothetical protein